MQHDKRSFIMEIRMAEIWIKETMWIGRQKINVTNGITKTLRLRRARHVGNSVSRRTEKIMARK